MTENRESGLQRLRSGTMSVYNQHYIGTYFIIEDLKKAISRFGKGDVLDLGCGNKPYRSFFQHCTKYEGCDVVQSSENLVDYICMANDLPMKDGSYDTILSTQVLEHVADFQGVLSEAHRVLRNNGYAIFTVPFCWELHEEPYDFFRFSKHGLKYCFEKAGFEIVEIKANGGKWATLLQTQLNILMSTRKYRTIRARFIKLLFIRLRFMYLYNRFGVWLDKKYFDDIITLNYIVIAQKKEPQSII